MMDRVSSLAFLAVSMKLEPAHAVALPTVFDVAVGKVGMTGEAFLAECRQNRALREYLADLCRQVIDQTVAEAGR